MAQSIILLLLAFPVILNNCSSIEPYRYVPTGSPENEGKHTSEAVYFIPFQSPTGTVKISAPGIIDVKSKSGKSKTVPAMHIRLTISNQSKVRWIVIAKNQIVAFPNRAEITPAFIKSDSKSLPTVDIYPDQLSAIDLYFDLPIFDHSSKDVPDFDFRWEVQTQNEVVKHSTSFGRILIPQNRESVYPYDPFYDGIGVGPMWWGNRDWYP